MWKIEISEIVETAFASAKPGPEADKFVEVCVKRYEQTTDTIDLKAIIAAVNKTARKTRTKKGDAA